jgi:hypothetical protein
MAGNIAYGVLGGFVGVVYLAGIGLYVLGVGESKGPEKNDPGVVMEERPTTE